jgi:uncharacterized RDD family membrane protein YckC
METGPTPPRGPAGPESPAPQQPYPQQPYQPPGYPGPVPPGGWQQPVAKPAWAGPPLADWWPRVGATLLDWLVVFVAFVPLVVPGIVLVAVNDGGALGIVLLVLGGLTWAVGSFLYAPFFVQRSGQHNGQTLGKQWVGLRVVRDKGEPFGFGWALLREFVVKYLLFVSVGGSFLIPTLLDWLWPLWDDENRALHDMIVSTHVVKAQ